LRARQPLAARLVTLAACEAAVTSGGQRIDEIVGFPAALLRAGVGHDGFSGDSRLCEAGARENIPLIVQSFRDLASANVRQKSVLIARRTV